MATKLPAITEEDRVIESIQSMDEVDIHKEVIWPLLKVLGATHVEYVHGPTEKGKDFIFVHPDFHGNARLEVCQVKNEPFRGRAGNDHVSAVLNQMIQCVGYEVLNPCTQKLELPKGAILYSMYELPEKGISGASGLLASFQKNNCEFVGPVKISKLIA